MYSPTGYASGPSIVFGTAGANPDDAVFEAYAGTSGQFSAHFHNNGVQSTTGGGIVSINSTPTGTPAAIASGNRLGSLQWGGTYDNTLTLLNGPAVNAYATQTWTVAHLGSKIDFRTVPNNSTTRTVALTLDQDQSATFANTVNATTFVGALTGNASSATSATTAGTLTTAIGANKVLGALTAVAPTGLSVPSCSAANSALIWTSGTGFGCNTISAGSGTVTSVTFTGDGTVLSSTPSTAVTTSGTVTGSLLNAGAYSIFGNNTSGSAAPAYQTSPRVSGALTAAQLIPTSATIPTDGLYLPAANTSAIADRTLPVMTFSNPASAVDYLSVLGAATSTVGAPSITAAGSDTNIGIRLSPKAAGGVTVVGTAGSCVSGPDGVCLAYSTGAGHVSVGDTGSTDALQFEQAGVATATIQTDGGLFMAGATGGSEGAGTINAHSGVYVDGVIAALLGKNQSFTKGQAVTPSILTSTATVTPDFSLSNVYTLTATQNFTLALPTGASAGQSGSIIITQDGTGSRTMATAAGYKVPGGTALVLSTASGAKDILSFLVETATTIDLQLGKDFK